MKFFKSKAAAYLTDAFCAILLGAALNLVLLSYLGLNTTFGISILVILVSTAIVFALSRKWWILPALISFSAAVAFLIAALLGDTSALVLSLRGFADWCLAGLPESSPFSLPINYLVVQLLISIPIAAVSLLFFRKLFVFILLIFPVLGILFWLYFYYGTQFFLVLALMFLLVLMSLSKATAKRINRKLPSVEKIAPALLPVTALLLTGVVLVFAFAFAPKDNGEWRAVRFVNAVQDIRDLVNNNTSDGPLEGDSGLKDSGFSPLRAHLGGNLSPSDTVVMRVTTDTPTLLTGAVFSTYDSTLWYRSHPLRRFRMESGLWRDKRNTVFDYNKPIGGRQAKALYDQVTIQAKYRIIYDLLGRTLFYAGRIDDFESAQFDVSEVYFNSQGELFIAFPQKRLRYDFTATVFNTGAEAFDENMLALEAITLTVKDPNLDAVQSEYLTLPDSVPDSVYTKAAQITAECKTPYEKASAIKNWLKQSCTYTLTPGDPPAYTDFVAYFLENRAGYCEYYASAMTVLARCQGLPARYVAGYALKRNPDIASDDAYIATPATAHAWSEIYFQGIGWVPFDATSWNFDEQGIASASNETLPPAVLLETLNQTMAETEEDPANHTGLPIIIRIILSVLAGGGIAVMLMMLIRFILLTFGASSYYKWLCRRYSDPKTRMDACCRRIIRQAAFLTIGQQNGETLSQFAARVDRALGVGGDDMSKACESVILMRFAEVEPSDNDLIRLTEFSAMLETRLRHDLGIVGYVWRRLMIGK